MKRVAVVLTVLLAISAVPAFANLITFGTSGTITYTGNGAGSVSVSYTGGSGGGTFQPSDFGTVTLGAVSFTAGPQAAGLFPASSPNESFDWLGLDGDHLAGNITWTLIQDNTPQPKWFGVLTIGAISGDPAFVANFGPVGTKLGIDWINDPMVCTPSSNCTTLDGLALTTASATATVSSGEVRPIPEPASMVLLGSGLVGLSGLVRKRISK